MKRYLLLLAVALGALAALSACGKEDTDSKEPEKIDLLDLLGKEDKLYQDLTISSKAMSKKMTYSVWLPNGYSTAEKYPVLYLLHGYEQGDQSHLDRCWVEKGNARQIAKDYVADGGVPMIIVMPNGLSSFYQGAYETYLHTELIPYVEEAFGGNGKRAIAGLSMGGYGTLYNALKYPATFTYAYAMSPAANASMKAYIDAQADKSVFPAFTIEVGNQDTTVDNNASRELAEYMTEKGLTCEFIARDGIHYWDFWQECLPKALKKVGESFK